MRSLCGGGFFATLLVTLLAVLVQSSRARGPGDPRVQSREIRLYSVLPSDIQTRLEGLFPSELKPLAPSAGQPSGFTLRPRNGHATVEVSWAENSQLLRLRGHAPVALELEKLVRTLDLDQTNRGQLVIRSGRRGGASLLATSPVQPAQYVAEAQFFGKAAEPEPTEHQASQRETNPPDLDPRLRARLRDLGKDIQVEVLPELDVIVLRGRDRNLEELAGLINEIERLAADAQPQIEVYPLQHAQSTAVAELIETVEEDYTGPRQGRVSVTALGKPNSLLIVGWGAAVEATLELIRKLDQPVAPDSQTEVFFLKHASATAAATLLNNFFDDRPGLGAKLTVTSDLRTNSLIVHAAPRDLQEARRLVEELDRATSSSVDRIQVIELENTLATELSTVLESVLLALREDDEFGTAAIEFFSTDEAGMRALMEVPLDRVKITPDPKANTLIVSGPTTSLEAFVSLVKRLDRPRDSVQIKVFHVVHGAAADLVQVLESLLVSDSDAPAALPNADGEDALVSLGFSVDQRTNSILASGAEGDLLIVETLLARLDQPDAAQRMNAVYHLKNSPAVDVAAAINQFLRTERQIDQAAPGAASLLRQIEKEVVVVPEPVSNKLILSATDRYFHQLHELIQRLDEPPPQVVIQVLIGEVTLANAEEFGIELGLQDTVLFDRGLLSDLLTTTNTSQQSTADGVITVTEEIIQSAINAPGFTFNNNPLGNSASEQALANSGSVGGQGLASFAVGRLNTELGFGGLVLSASSENVSVLLRALQESRRIEILSRPQVRTLDNQPAFIQVGQRVPRIATSTLTQFGQTNTVDFIDVGLILGVTPRISPDGTVVMEIDAEKSSISTEAEGVPVSSLADGTVLRAPIINTTRAETTVSAASGETIILAGLITKDTVEIHRRVPYLSSIPLVGDLFRFDSMIGKRTELLIIMTPRVIYSSEDNERVKQVELARMNWCAADVYNLHGDINYAVHEDPAMFDANTEVIYPDLGPTGAILPEEAAATPSNTNSDPMIEPAANLPTPTDLRDSPMVTDSNQPATGAAGDN